MSLDKIVLGSMNREAYILNQDGSRFNEFVIPNYAYNILQRGKKIFISSDSGLTCYDYNGNEEWKVTECYSETEAPIAYNKDGFYIINLVPRSEVEEKDLNKDQILGTTFNQYYPEHLDLWAAHVDFNGNLKWHKFLQEMSNSEGILANDSNLVIPYYTKNSSGFHILDLEGNLLNTEERILGRTMALVNDLFVYKNVDNGSTEAYNIKKGNIEFLLKTNIPISGNQITCWNLDNKVFFSNPAYIEEVDLEKRKSKLHNIINYGMCVSGSLIIVDRAPKEFLKTNLMNKIGDSAITGYNQEMKKLWEFIPENQESYAVSSLGNNTFLAFSRENLEKIGSDGKILWRNNLRRNSNKVARLIVK